jgi:hypothetical protein
VLKGGRIGKVAAGLANQQAAFGEIEIASLQPPDAGFLQGRACPSRPRSLAAFQRGAMFQNIWDIKRK